MRVLTLTWPLTAVSDRACGGAEQIAALLIARLSRIPALQLTWIGAPGSDTRRRVRFLGWPELLRRHGLWRPQPALYTPDALADLQRRCRDAVLRAVAADPPDLIHDQGAFFAPAAAATRVPVLLTLHLARELYPAAQWNQPPSRLHLHCVSHTQQREYGPLACCGVIANGIALSRFRPRRHPAPATAPLLYLGRICPEKAPHLAIEIARRARRRLWLVGDVAPFPSHQRYFQDCICPHLGPSVAWLPAPAFACKRTLLRQAAALVIPSRIAETSSLVAMEAAASGVPALALRAGALPEIVAHGRTGWVAETPEELADCAATQLPLPPRRGGIAPAECRLHAERAFCAERMAAEYAGLYRRLTRAGGLQ